LLSLPCFAPYPALRSKAIEHARKHNPTQILIENTGVGSALVADLKAAGFPAVGITPHGDKVARMSVHSTKFENGQVLLPRDAPWLCDLEAELFAFPNGSHTDQVDAIGQALAYTAAHTYMWTDKALENLANMTGALTFERYLRSLGRR
jgi:predicted phage terminase large subunit-like protein